MVLLSYTDLLLSYLIMHYIVFGFQVVVCTTMFLFVIFFLVSLDAINVGSVQYNGGLLPDIILSTQGYYHRGTRFYAMNMFCLCSL